MRWMCMVAVVVACSSPAQPPPHLVPVPPPAPSAPVAVAPPDPAPPGLRLPGDIKPLRYRLDLTIVPDDAKAPGKVAIDAEVVRPLRVVWLNASGLTIAHASLGQTPARVIPGDDDHVGLTLDRELPPGPLLVELAFTAPIDHEKSRGIYAEKDGPESYAYSFFEPIDARRAFPCFDEPAFKVPWQLTMHVRADHVALGNAPVVAETPEPNGMKRVELAETKPLPSYLVAFVAGPFEIVDDGVAGRAKTPVRFIVPKGRAPELAYAKSVTPRVVAALEDYFDMAYPYGKLDVAVVPRYWGTMEHPGIVAMGQPLALIRPDQATRERKHHYTNILAHELGHYWFGDYVTLAWWDDTWLNEALGEWFDLIITDAAEPSWRVMLDTVDRAADAMWGDETLTTKAIRQPATTREDVEGSFDAVLVYSKGNSVLRMFEQAVGPEKWRDFLRGYVRAHAWGNATADDLFAAARAALGAEVEAGLRSFLEQPGVPRISGQLSCTGGSAVLALHQQRALPAGVTDPTPRLWTVPVCVRYGTAKTTGRACTYLSAADGELALPGACPTWTLLNAGGFGYYRSTVDPAQAAQFFAPRSPLTVLEKLMLVHDVRAAVDREEMPIGKALALAPLLARDPDDRAAAAAFTLSEMRSDGLDDAMYAKYAAFLVKSYKPLAAKLGWKRAGGDSDDRNALRARALGVAYHDAALAAQARPIALAWLDSRAALDDELVEPMLSAVTHHGDAALFDRILAEARAPRDRTDQGRLLAALGGFTDPALVQRALALPLGTEFDLRDSLGILYQVMGHRETRPAAMAFVEAHLDELLARMRNDEASWLLTFLAEAPCDQPNYDRIAKLLPPRAQKIAGADAVVVRGLEISRQCIALTQRQLPGLTAFLAGR